MKPLRCLRKLGTKIHGPKYKPESPSRMDDIQEESIGELKFCRLRFPYFISLRDWKHNIKSV